MIFLGTPTQIITTIKKIGIKKRPVYVGRFDENGEFETTDETIIEKMKPHFEVKEETQTKPDEPITEITNETLIKCKKCEAEFENKGLLLAHIRKEHPKK